MPESNPSNTAARAAVRLDAEREDARRAQALADCGIWRLPPLVRPSKLAQILDMDRQRIYELVASGTLDGLRMGPRGLRVTRASVERWLAGREVV